MRLTVAPAPTLRDGCPTTVWAKAPGLLCLAAPAAAGPPEGVVAAAIGCAAAAAPAPAPPQPPVPPPKPPGKVAATAAVRGPSSQSNCLTSVSAVADCQSPGWGPPGPTPPGAAAAS